MAKPDMSGSMMLSSEGIDFIIEKRKTQSGEVIECATFPLPTNKFLTKTEKGNLFFKFVCWLEDQSKWDEYKKTHSIQIDFGEEENKRRKDSGLKNIYVGGITDWRMKNNSQSDNVPSHTTTQFSTESTDDLPF